jgi:hypothetical protein
MPVFQVGIKFLQVHDQLFKTKQTRLPESNSQEHEKDCVNNQATDIEDLLFSFDKSDQLIIVHQHAECKLYPVHHLQPSRLGPNPGLMNNLVDILNKEDAH